MPGETGVVFLEADSGFFVGDLGGAGETRIEGWRERGSQSASTSPISQAATEASGWNLKKLSKNWSIGSN